MYLLIIIIIIVAAVLLAVWGFQQRNAHLIKQADEKAAALDGGDVTTLIHAIKSLNLSGESLKTFTKWQRAYQKLSEGSLTDLQTQLLDVENANKQYKIFQVKKQLAAITELSDEAAKDLADINAALAKIKESESDNRAKLLKLRSDYQTARKTVLAKSYAFGDALPVLEKQLQQLNDQIDTVAETNQSGDHAKAQAQLAQLKTEIKDLQGIVKALPPLVNQVVNEFPGQLIEIQQGYTQLQAQKYQFTEDVPEKTQAAKEELAKAQKQLAAMNVTELGETCAQLASDIDALYAVMEKEILAKKNVLHEVGDLKQFIAHAEKQNHALLLELDRLSQSYALNHDEIATANDLRSELESIHQAYDTATVSIDRQQAIFSEIAAQFSGARESLKQIELKQVAINESVTGLKAAEKQADAQAQQFEMDLRDVKYEVSRHGLPGLPRPYLDFFNVCTKEVDDLNKALDQLKLDLDAIAKQLIKISEDIEQLKDQSRTLVDAAGMCEQLLQYANRYKTSHEDIAAAVKAASQLYAHYNYKEAADTIGTALEKVEPGSYQKVEDDYTAQKSASLF